LLAFFERSHYVAQAGLEPVISSFFGLPGAGIAGVCHPTSPDNTFDVISGYVQILKYFLKIS
jgi:hypothetical protein